MELADMIIVIVIYLEVALILVGWWGEYGARAAANGDARWVTNPAWHAGRGRAKAEVYR